MCQPVPVGECLLRNWCDGVAVDDDDDRLVVPGGLHCPADSLAPFVLEVAVVVTSASTSADGDMTEWWLESGTLRSLWTTLGS